MASKKKEAANAKQTAAAAAAGNDTLAAPPGDRPAHGSPGASAISISDTAGENTAQKIFDQEQAKEVRKLKLSRMSFFRDAVRIQGSVFSRILPSVLGYMCYATITIALALLTGIHIQLPASVIGPLSIVTGLLVVFRNSSSWNQWYEGRKDYQSAMSDVRSLARVIWQNIDVTVPAASDPNSAVPGAKATKELIKQRIARKKRAIRLLSAYLYACKHHLRGEHGAHYEDYKGILPDDVAALYQKGEEGTAVRRGSAIPRHDSTTYLSQNSGTPLDPEATAAQSVGRRRSWLSLKGRKTVMSEEPETLNEETPLAQPKGKRKNKKKPQVDSRLRKHTLGWDGTRPAMGLPLYIIYEINRYLAGVRRSGMQRDVAGSVYGTGVSLCNSLTSVLGNMERNATTTIPTIYGVHLKQALLLYVCFLPLTLVNDLQWFTLPFVTLIFYTLAGLEGISSEIENPWGDDASDLNLDFFAAEIRHELEHMMFFIPEGAEDE